jgi:hypothetical protein
MTSKYTVRAWLTISHTNEVEAESEEQAWEIVNEWIADDHTEDDDCSRSWRIEIS